MKKARLIKLAAVLTAFGLIAAACGGGSNGGAQGPSGSEFNKGENPVFNPGTPTKGGTMKWASVGDVDYMDPGAAYTVSYFAYIAHGTLRMLTTYPGTPELSEQTQVVPDLATDLGEPSDGNKTWTYHLKDGIKFGPALGGQNVPGVTGEEITSQDIKYAIERLFIPSVGAGYATYYEMIEGVDEFKKANAKGGPIKGEISGIETPDDKTIVFHLTRAVGDWDLRVSMPGTSPVPQDFAQKYDSQKDSDYDSHVVFSGPYYVASYTPQEHVLLKRNTEWDPATDDVRKAYVDQVDWKQGFENSVCVQKVLDNDYDTAVDCDPEGAQLQKVVTQPDYKKRFFNGLEPCTGYVFLNTTVEPFDDIKVRQAVNYAVDRGNLLKILGGQYTGMVASSILPPGMVGYLDPDEYDPFNAQDGPQVDKAKDLIKEAGLSGGYDGPPLLLVGDASGAGPKQVEAMKQDLGQIGFEDSDFKVKEVNYPDYYTQYYQEPSSNTAIGFAAWCEDFPSPDTFLTPLLYGPNILPHANSNYSETDDQELNRLIEEAQQAAGSDAEDAWAAANKRATELASWVPYRWYRARLVTSERAENAYYHSYYESVDWVNMGVGGGS